MVHINVMTRASMATLLLICMVFVLSITFTAAMNLDGRERERYAGNAWTGPLRGSSFKKSTSAASNSKGFFAKLFRLVLHKQKADHINSSCSR